MRVNISSIKRIFSNQSHYFLDKPCTSLVVSKFGSIVAFPAVLILLFLPLRTHSLYFSDHLIQQLNQAHEHLSPTFLTTFILGPALSYTVWSCENEMLRYISPNDPQFRILSFLESSNSCSRYGHPLCAHLRAFEADYHAT